MEYKDNKCEPMGGSLIGSNGAITSIDINNEVLDCCLNSRFSVKTFRTETTESTE